MLKVKNTVALDWRKGPDCIYFIFKDENTYCRLDLADGRLAPGHPTTIDGHWGGFEPHIKNLCFGLTITDLSSQPPSDGDVLWLFYTENDTPMVCAYSQDEDKVVSKSRLAGTFWGPLVPHFKKIIGAIWTGSDTWEADERRTEFRRKCEKIPSGLSSGYFATKTERKLSAIYNRNPKYSCTAPEAFEVNVSKKFSGHKIFMFLNDGTYIECKYPSGISAPLPLADTPWAKLEPYKDLIMTIVQNDQPLFYTEFYIFLKDGRYLIMESQLFQLKGPFPIEKEFPYLMQDTD